MKGITRIAVFASLAGATLFACRDASEPFRPDDRDPVDQSSLRLTYSDADDRTPVWSANGDSVYFTTSAWEQNPLAPATVLALAADGAGSLTELLRNVQVGTGRAFWIAAPAIHAEGDRVAFVRVRNLLPEGPCVGTRMCPVMANLPMVRLVSAELHVRAIDATNGPNDDILLPLEFAGHAVESDPGAPGGSVAISEYHPFQFQFETEGRAFFRPSWNPDGTELVVSDGLRLLRWTLGAAEGVPIAGTADGIGPAWSPNGEWIAFTRLERTGSQTFICEYVNVYETGPNTDCVERRTMYTTADPQIVLVRPDGSEQIVLGPGIDPAWSPDGSAVYASTPVGGVDMIVRIPLGDGPTTVVPGTDRGIEPAISPDGERLAFARAAQLAKPATHDIWVIELP